MSVANSYANALFQAAKDHQISSEEFDEMEIQLQRATSILMSPQIRAGICGPATSIQEKTVLLNTVSEKLEFSKLMTQFFNLLVRKNRLSLLKQIQESFNSVRLASEGGVAGLLIAAEPLLEADIGILVKALSQKLGKKVTFRVSTDASLLAGIKVTVNGVTYDGTLRSQLQKLRDRFVTGLPGAHA